MPEPFNDPLHQPSDITLDGKSFAEPGVPHPDWTRPWDVIHSLEEVWGEREKRWVSHLLERAHADKGFGVTLIESLTSQIYVATDLASLSNGARLLVLLGMNHPELKRTAFAKIDAWRSPLPLEDQRYVNLTFARNMLIGFLDSDRDVLMRECILPALIACHVERCEKHFSAHTEIQVPLPDQILEINGRANHYSGALPSMLFSSEQIVDVMRSRELFLDEGLNSLLEFLPQGEGGISGGVLAVFTKYLMTADTDEGSAFVHRILDDLDGESFEYARIVGRGMSAIYEALLVVEEQNRTEESRETSRVGGELSQIFLGVVQWWVGMNLHSRAPQEFAQGTAFLSQFAEAGNGAARYLFIEHQGEDLDEYLSLCTFLSQNVAGAADGMTQAGFLRQILLQSGEVTQKMKESMLQCAAEIYAGSLEQRVTGAATIFEHYPELADGPAFSRKVLETIRSAARTNPEVHAEELIAILLEEYVALIDSQLIASDRLPSFEKIDPMVRIILEEASDLVAKSAAAKQAIVLIRRGYEEIQHKLNLLGFVPSPTLFDTISVIEERFFSNL